MKRNIAIILSICLILGLSTSILAALVWTPQPSTITAADWTFIKIQGDPVSIVNNKIVSAGWGTRTFGYNNKFTATKDYRYEIDMQTTYASTHDAGLLFNYSFSGTVGVGYRLIFSGANSGTVRLYKTQDAWTAWNDNASNLIATSPATYNAVNNSLHHISITCTTTGHITIVATPNGGTAVTLFDLTNTMYPVGKVGILTGSAPVTYSNLVVSYLQEESGPTPSPTPSQTPIPGLLYQQTFDSTPSNWTLSTFAVTGGTVGQTGYTQGSGYYTGQTFNGTYRYNVDFSGNNAGGVANSTEVLFNMQGDLASCYALVFEGGAASANPKVKLNKYLSGPWDQSTIFTTTNNYVIQNKTVHVSILYETGGYISAWATIDNNTTKLIDRFHDTSYTNGKIGMLARFAPTNFDNVLVLDKSYQIGASTYTLGAGSIAVSSAITEGEVVATPFAAAYNAAGKLIGVGDLTKTGATFTNNNILVSDTVSKVKIFVWVNDDSIQPKCKSVVATKN